MCFGIGEGLGFWYLKDIPLSPSILLHVRTYPLEKNFFTNINVPFKWEKFPSPDTAICGLKQKISNGHPALVQTDIYYLPYFNSSTHFPGHAIVVWGIDEEKKEFYVSDTQYDQLLPVSYENMKKAIYYPRGFFKSMGNQFSIPSLSFPSNLEIILQKAIFFTSYHMLSPPNKDEGLKGMVQWIKEIEQWQELEDWRWTTRFTYQVIEKRGTGGGGFRFLYGEYLKEVSTTYLPWLEKQGLVEQMNELGTRWERVAYTLREISEAPSPKFSHLKPLLIELYHAEETFHLTILKSFKDTPALKSIP